MESFSTKIRTTRCPWGMPRTVVLALVFTNTPCPVQPFIQEVTNQDPVANLQTQLPTAGRPSSKQNVLRNWWSVLM